MENIASFEIAYTGSSVDGVMDVKELAPALLAIDELIQITNQIIGNPEVEITTVVDANFEKGSFHIVFELISILLDTTNIFLELNSLENLSKSILSGLGLIAASTCGLLPLIKTIRGRKIKTTTVLDNGKIKLEVQGANGDFDYIEVTEDTMHLYKNKSIRETIPKILKPIKSDGIDSLEIRKEKEAIAIINKQEVEFYEGQDSIDEAAKDSVTSSRRALVNIEDIPLNQPELKWKLSEGYIKFWAVLKDHEFLELIENQKISFIKGDVLEIELETSSKTVKSKVRSEYMITKIYRHIHPEKENLLFSSNEDDL